MLQFRRKETLRFCGEICRTEVALVISVTRPPTTSVRTSTTSVRPSTTIVRPSTTSVQTSTTSVRPSTTNVRPSTTNVRPSTTSFRTFQYRTSGMWYRAYKAVHDNNRVTHVASNNMRISCNRSDV